MKLYLSSAGIPEPSNLLALIDTSSPHVSIIPNARDVYPEEVQQEENKRAVEHFAELGIKPHLIDLRQDTGDVLRDKLASHPLVWVMGGNTFYLNEQVHKSGMAGFLRQLLEDGLVYGGESAGAVLACPTLHGVELMDDPEKASEQMWDGLGLVDFGIVPHWGMEKYSEILEKCKAEMEKYVEVQTLSNDEAMVIHNSEITIVGKQL
jgi:dipeptidase E